MIRSVPGIVAIALLTFTTVACDSGAVEAPWMRPETPAAPSPSGLTWVEDPGAELTWFFADGALLALYNNAGNTFIEFWVDGVNLIGGYDRGAGRTNLGSGRKGHGPLYPFGQVDPQLGFYGQWEGFWAGYNYMDERWVRWTGPNGAPQARRSFEVTAVSADALDVHVEVLISFEGTALFSCDVHYLVTREGIGVRDDVTILSDLRPLGFADTGAQLLMTQIDTDLDPALPQDREHQVDQYFELAMDGHVEPIDPFPPYNDWSPSNIYTDYESYDPTHLEKRAHGLPDRARVTTSADVSYLTPMGRASRASSLALRVDLKRSTVPPLEFYCELNGDRDFLNYLYSAALGSFSGVPVVPAGTRWRLYGELRPWQGSDPEVLRSMPLLSDAFDPPAPE